MKYVLKKINFIKGYKHYPENNLKQQLEQKN